jgi:hypothetical protein
VIKVTREVSALPVTTAEREEHRAILEAKGRIADPSWRWNGAEMPRTKPAYRSILTGVDGRIWIQLSAPAIKVDSAKGIHAPTVRGRSSGIPVQRWIERNVWDVFESGGTYIGQVELPIGVTLHTARGDVVWVSGFGPDDEPNVQRLRIVWP